MGAIDTRSVQKHAYVYYILERVMEREDVYEMEEVDILKLMEAEFNIIVPPPATTIIVPEFNEA
jgi:hypothetical protein